MPVPTPLVIEYPLYEIHGRDQPSIPMPVGSDIHGYSAPWIKLPSLGESLARLDHSLLPPVRGITLAPYDAARRRNRRRRDSGDLWSLCGGDPHWWRVPPSGWGLNGGEERHRRQGASPPSMDR
jgi:hypothetical protein